MEDGARLATAMMSSITARGTGSALKPRTLLRVLTSSSKSISGILRIGREAGGYQYIKSGMLTFLQVRPNEPTSAHHAAVVVAPSPTLSCVFGVEIAGVVALVQLARGLAADAVDHPPALHGRPFGDRVGPALHVLVLLHAEELGRAVEPALRQPAIPGPDRRYRRSCSRRRPDIRSPPGAGRARRADASPPSRSGRSHIRSWSAHRRRSGRSRRRDRARCPSARTAMTGIRRARRLGRQERAELLGEMHQDRAGFEHPDRLRPAAVQQRRDLGVRD